MPLLAGLAWLASSGLAQELELPGSAPSATGELPAEGATERELEAEIDVDQDRRIAERLRATFAGVEALRGIRVSANTGVVRLVGEVPSAAGRELAGQLARQIEGVALVENEIRVAQDVGRRLEVAWDNLRQRLFGVIGTLPLLAVPALILLLFWYLGRFVAGLSWPYRRIDNAFLRETAQQLVRIAVLVAGVLLALEILDATALVAALLGTAGLFGLVLGFASARRGARRVQRRHPLPRLDRPARGRFSRGQERGDPKGQGGAGRSRHNSARADVPGQAAAGRGASRGAGVRCGTARTAAGGRCAPPCGRAAGGRRARGRGPRPARSRGAARAVAAAEE